MPVGRPTGSRSRRRYAHIGPLYDLVSFERLLYRRPRRELMAMLGPLPGGTVIDVGCGTGLNLSELRRLVGTTGRIIGVDASASMLAVAGRRVRAAGWTNVTLIDAQVEDLPGVLGTAEAPIVGVAAVVATFVVSILEHDTEFWRVVDQLAAVRPVRVALADLGHATRAGPVRRAVLHGLAVLGGAHLDVRPWADLALRAGDVDEAIDLAGHVRLAVGTVAAR